MSKHWIQQSNWYIRRRFMFTVSAFCMLTISYVLVAGVTTEAAEAAVTMGFAALLGIVGSYVFGATWEDISLGAPGRRNTKPSAIQTKEGEHDF